MPTVDEVALSSDAEIEAYLRQLLRPGEDIVITWNNFWLARVVSGETLLWDLTGFDRRVLLLDVYGWLWKRTQPAVSPLWRRRQELTRADVNRQATSSREPDPEDVDPGEVQAVYEGRHSHRKKD